MDGQQQALHLLQQLTTKHYIQFLPRGNAAIKQALRYAKQQGRTKLLIPDQGGWMTYSQFGKELGFEIKEIKTKDGYIEPAMISGDAQTVLLMNTMPAYAFTIPVVAIAEKCKAQNTFFINDASATIGTPEATLGDIIIGSCNRWKPLPLQKGGFIATNNLLEEKESPELDYAKLVHLLDTLKERCTEIYHRANKLKLALENYNVLYPNHKGFNVIVAYDADEEKEKLINDVKIVDATIEHTECPRYIRVNKKALSFEIKRQFDTM